MIYSMEKEYYLSIIGRYRWGEFRTGYTEIFSGKLMSCSSVLRMERWYQSPAIGYRTRIINCPDTVSVFRQTIC